MEGDEALKVEIAVMFLIGAAVIVLSVTGSGGHIPVIPLVLGGDGVVLLAAVGGGGSGRGYTAVRHNGGIQPRRLPDESGGRG
ncbi:hypothetical protein, partial [Streptomyces fagopyri]